MKLLNRSALVLQPRQTYLDWINALPRDVSELEQPLTPASLDVEGRVYLVDEFEPEQGGGAILAGHWQPLLSNELAAWDEFGDHWPEPLNQALFTEWFEFKPLALAFDASDQTLMTAQL